MFTCSTNCGVQVWNTHNAELHCEVRWLNGYNPFWVPFAFSPVRGYLAYGVGNRVSLWRFKEVLD